MTEESLPSLKLITIDPASPDSLAAVRRLLIERLDESEIQKLFTHGFIVNTALGPSDVRDLVAPALGDDQEALVVEFERLSGHGGAGRSAWPIPRGP